VIHTLRLLGSAEPLIPSDNLKGYQVKSGFVGYVVSIGRFVWLQLRRQLKPMSAIRGIVDSGILSDTATRHCMMWG
jgi:hypothetical protein